jgi:predicted unusual protein kinase regulating ubiquinone biosynthesis (AarF/ABC1/UbiB family)
VIKTRYRRIVSFFGRVLLSLAWWEIVLPRLGLGRLTRRTRAERLRRAAVQFRALAIQMGGVLIKVGQFLSARVDVLPPEFTRELEGLQDEVPAERFEDIRRVAEADLGEALTEKFLEFDPAPLAAASLGQAHQALLANETFKAAESGETSPPAAGIAVVVKVQRPDIEAIIATDLAALRRVGRWIMWYGPVRRRVNIPALLDEFTRTLYEEVDYLAEGRNAETFAANFRDFPGVRVPRVFWTHTSKRVLTLENVGAIKITDYPAVTAAGIDRRQVASRLLKTYLKQIFEDGFFHADPHPGNLFVTPLAAPDMAQAEDWLLTFIDFGMVGRISPKTRAGARELLIAVGTRDAGRVIKAYQMLGMLLPGADLALLERANQQMFDRFWGKSMNELQQVDMSEMVNFAIEFRDLLYGLPFQVP